MTADDVRARFEAWAQREQYALSRLPTGAYADYDTQNAWFGYRAAHADLSGEVRELVEAASAATEEKMNDGASSKAACDRLVAALAKFTHQEKP